MTQADTASGDLLADRRADYAEMLFANGEHAAAADLMLEALEPAPSWALGWFRLGEFQAAAGRAELAERAWRLAHSLDPDDRAGAGLKLQLTGAEPLSRSPPSAFVEALFDQYADRFEQSLVETLGYRVPDLLVEMLRKIGTPRFACALDLGCGTGLMGEPIRPMVDRLEGHDISAAMLTKARAKNIYDRLVKSDLQTLVLLPASADLITAADVFLYVGALDRIVGEIAHALRPGGLFAFSVETQDGPEDFVLRETRRYAHSEDYLRRTLAAANLSTASIETAIIRQDRGRPVDGLIVIAGFEADSTRDRHPAYWDRRID